MRKLNINDVRKVWKMDWQIKPIFDFADQHNLTPREVELIKLMAIQGLSSRSMAEKLHIQEKTVHVHIRNIFQKTETTSSRELLSKLIVHLLAERGRRMEGAPT